MEYKYFYEEILFLIFIAIDYIHAENSQMERAYLLAYVLSGYLLSYITRTEKQSEVLARRY